MGGLGYTAVVTIQTTKEKSFSNHPQIISMKKAILQSEHSKELDGTLENQK